MSFKIKVAGFASTEDWIKEDGSGEPEPFSNAFNVAVANARALHVVDYLRKKTKQSGRVHVEISPRLDITDIEPREDPPAGRKVELTVYKWEAPKLKIPAAREQQPDRSDDTESSVTGTASNPDPEISSTQ